MSTRAIDLKSWDWNFGKGLQDYKTEKEEIEQNILTSIKSWRNNCFFDLDAGIDWYNILGSFEEKNYLKKELSKILITIDGVVKINNIDININNDRSIQVYINLDTIYSNSDFYEIINING